MTNEIRDGVLEPDPTVVGGHKRTERCIAPKVLRVLSGDAFHPATGMVLTAAVEETDEEGPKKLFASEAVHPLVLMVLGVAARQVPEFAAPSGADRAMVMECPTSAEVRLAGSES